MTDTRTLSVRPLPSWVREIRPHQATAVDQIVEAFETVPVVFLDAPTGSGKTLIAELVARELRVDCLYVCSDKTLQDQFARDFPYAKVLKGRANYPTRTRGHTCDECTYTPATKTCWFCPSLAVCPYQIAKNEALAAPLAVTNTSYLLAEANYVGGFSGRGLIVADEADVLERTLMGFVEYVLRPATMNELGVVAPIKGARKTTLITWLTDVESKANALAIQFAKRDDVVKANRYASLASETKRVREELEREVAHRGDTEGDGDADQGRWLRDYTGRDDTVILRPVSVDSYGTRRLWRHGERWLIMSATIISADEMAASLGLPYDYATVTVPMTFPAESRPIVMAPVADATFKNMRVAVPQLVHAIGQVLADHPDESILVHTVSYRLAQQLHDGVAVLPIARGRDLLTYESGRVREMVLSRFKANRGSVMFAPSMGRGVDLPDDLCRVQVIAKVPFLSLGDRQVAARSHMPGGQAWYVIQAIRTVIQMTGRAIRNEDDYAITYIFDAQFATNLWRKNKEWFPKWWRDSVKTNLDIRKYMMR